MTQRLKKALTFAVLVINTFFLVLTVFNGMAFAFSMPDRMGWGARAIGMGGAFTGVADDPTATYYNPAGLIQIDGHATDNTTRFVRSPRIRQCPDCRRPHHPLGFAAMYSESEPDCLFRFQSWRQSGSSSSIKARRGHWTGD